MSMRLCRNDGDIVELPDGTRVYISIMDEPISDENDAKSYAMAERITDALNLVITLQRTFQK